jgi:hypothetical protein
MNLVLFDCSMAGSGVARSSPRNLYIASSPQAFSAQGAVRPERVGISNERISK